MAQKSKYADISDIDDAPEYYQTTDSPRRIQEEFSSSSYSSDYDVADEQAISRQGTRADRARKQFQLTKVDARGVDFSDRLHRKRHSYKTSYQRARGKNVTKIGDFSDEEDETLARKLARLQREVKEVQEEFERKRKEREERDDSDDGEESDEGDEDDEDITHKIQRMSEALDRVYLENRRRGPTAAELHLVQTARQHSKATAQLQIAATNGTDGPDTREEFLHVSIIPSAAQAQQRHALAKAADFDTRLSALETALGLNNLNLPEIAKEQQRPILHTLEALDTQISALATPSSAILDIAGRKLLQLTQDAERLETLRKTSQPPSSRVSKLGTPNLNGEGDGGLDVASLSKINDLYKTLPTIESLSPSLPMVVERLRTLRLIHTSAGSAHATLEDIEKHQMVQAAEIMKWNKTLLQVEKGLEKGDEALKRNIGSMGVKVRALEERLEKLS